MGGGRDDVGRSLCVVAADGGALHIEAVGDAADDAGGKARHGYRVAGVVHLAGVGDDFAVAVWFGNDAVVEFVCCLVEGRDFDVLPVEMVRGCLESGRVHRTC